MTTDRVGPIRLVIVQPTPFCNIDCDYCYLTSRNDRRRMDFEVIDAIGTRVLGSSLAATDISVIWHAGEPTTVPVPWYDEAFERLARASRATRIAHSFQTNGIAIDDDWIALWRRHGVRIGLSIDGPRHFNRRRRTRAGGESFDLALRGLRRLRDAQVPFHVITVLTREALDHPDALVDFYLAEEITDICFNVEEEEGQARRSSLVAGVAVEAYGLFLQRVAERVFASGEALRCREIDAIAGLIATPAELRRHNLETTPLEIVSIAVDGGMSTYSPELLGVPSAEFGDFIFGNVRSEGPDAILRHPAFIRLRGEVEAGVAACSAKCAYFGVCGGGAPGNKFFEHGHFNGTETLFCRLTRKTVLDALLPFIESIAA